MQADQWLVIKSKSRHEKMLASGLEAAGFDVFLPLQTQIRVWSDRKKKVKMPLIPSTVFIRNTDLKKEILYNLPGFHSILYWQGKPGIVREEEIEHLRMLCTSELEWRQVQLPTVEKGEEVKIINGPFEGMFAKAIEESNAFRVLLEIEALGIGFTVNLPKNSIKTLG